MSQTNGSSIQKTEQQQPATLQQYLAMRTKHLSDVAARGLNPERLIKLAILATNKNPALAKCDMGSVFLALMQCAELGLEPSGTLGGAYLVPYGRQCQMIIGYRGLIDLARRSGVLEQVEAHVVYERDTFECEFGMTPKLRHVPEWNDDRGSRVLVYAIFRLKGGGVHVEVMGIREIEAIRQRSRSSGSGPWATDYDEMAKKTVVRRGAKYVPMSTEALDALERENDLDSGGTQADSGTAVLGVSRTSEVKAKLMAQNTVVEAVEAPAQVEVEEPPHPAETEEPSPEATGEPTLAEVLLAEIQGVSSEKDLDAIGRRAQDVPKGPDRDAVGKAINARRAEIRGAR